VTRRRIASALAAGAALCVLATACGTDSSPPAAAEHGRAPVRFQGTTLPPRTRQADFALRDQDGRLVRLSAERGRYVLLTFLYTRCHDVCPLTASSLNAVLSLLGRARDDVRVIAVSVDPKGDTPDSVRLFVKRHHLLPQFRYLTGSRAQLERLWVHYNVAVVPEADGQLRHEAYTTLIDRQGNGRVVYKPPASTPAVLHDLRMLLSGPSA
jgi:protein SCO1